MTVRADEAALPFCQGYPRIPLPPVFWNERGGPIRIDSGPRTLVEIASEIPAYSSQVATGAKWIFIILSSTALNAVLYAVGIRIPFIFGMVIPILPQIAGNTLYDHNALVLAAIAWSLTAGIYVLFLFLWHLAQTGKAWASYVVLGSIYAIFCCTSAEIGLRWGVT
jgi:hypothetical protein